MAIKWQFPVMSQNTTYNTPSFAVTGESWSGGGGAGATTYFTEEARRDQLSKLLVATLVVGSRLRGPCRACPRFIEPGESIWCYRKPGSDEQLLWCSYHRKTSTEETNTNKENDMAQRHNFIFHYTGADIAAALERQAAAIDTEVAAFAKLDPTTLAVLYPLESDRESVVAAHQNKAAKLVKQAEKLRTEARPYATAGAQTFDLDLDDVHHFQLDAEDIAPAKPRRIRRTAAQKAADAEPDA